LLQKKKINTGFYVASWNTPLPLVANLLKKGKVLEGSFLASDSTFSSPKPGPNAMDKKCSPTKQGKT